MKVYFGRCRRRVKENMGIVIDLSRAESYLGEDEMREAR